jgi:enamine deaminase RidA (YjgF/YER057c/UK114 family)
MFVTPEADFAEIGRAHAEVFGDVRPATAAIVVHALLDPRWLVEIEADALLG